MNSLSYRFYVYVDSTLESIPRVFYVGKGSGNRRYVRRRNWKHYQVRNDFGYCRNIVFSTDDLNLALLKEIELIKRYHTFVSDPEYNSVGCNFTAGGEGGSHPSLETRRLISQSNRLRKGEKRSFKACKHIQEGIRKSLQRRPKWNLSEEHKKRISQSNMGHQVKEQTREKLRQSSKLMHQNPVIKEKILVALRKSISICVLEIDPISNDVIKEHETMNAAAKAANLGVKYLRLALRCDDQEYLVKRTRRKWKRK
jgi:hypothetical protein